MKMYLLKVIGFPGLNLENIVGSTEHWCDIVLPSALNRAYVLWLSVLVCVQSDA